MDILVETSNPELLDRTVQAFNGLVMQGASAPNYEKHEGYFVVRSLSLPPQMLADMISQQGYGKVIRLIDKL
jgi:hypothetical protein